jgi:hypothetical protein
MPRMNLDDRIAALEARVAMLEAKKARPKVAKNLVVPTLFDAAWAAYPKRGGGNSRAMALKAWKSRMAEGIAEDALLDAVHRYRQYCEATERVGTEWVLMASTFFGPSKRYDDAWTSPKGKADDLDELLDVIATRGS